MCDNVLVGILAKKIVDPDGGANIERKRLQLQQAGLGGGTGHPNLDCSVPVPNDGWVKSLKKLPTVSFTPIYHHFMERSLEVVVGLRRAQNLPAECDEPSSADDNGEVFSSFRGNDKGHKFFKDGHVQNIEYNDIQGNPKCCCVRCKVLPSMNKCQPYVACICVRRNGLVDVRRAKCQSTSANLEASQRAQS